jgi:imidazoleglycerol phosphate synthase cyclase subunit
MIRPRLIPVLLLKNGLIVRSQRFKIHQAIGNPMSTVERLSHWQADELIILDISLGDRHDLRRDDLQQRYKGSSFLDVLEQIATVCHIPLTVGGGVRTLGDIEKRLTRGADRVSLNTIAVRDPGLISKAASEFGSQCIVVSVDVFNHEDGRAEVFIDGGRTATALDPLDWSREIQDRGVGEILLNSIDRDGTKAGYDLERIRAVTDAVDIPVIACGGVGTYDDFAPAFLEANAAAAAAANIFHFFELSYPLAKSAVIDAGVPLRQSELESGWFPREPIYDRAAEDPRIAERLERARQRALPDNTPPPDEKITWCAKCLYPTVSAAPIEFDEAGVCTGCQQAEIKIAIPRSEWERRETVLRGILDKHRSRDGTRHDCVIAVSGGKDSWFQVHILKNELGMNPLLVTYDGNNWTPAGWRNLLRMKEVFKCDHIVYSPSTEVLTKLNRLGFIVMGDMNWHAHVGITTIPPRVAAQNRIPLVIWGEHGYLDMGGQFAMDDYPEMSYRDRLEHFGRGYEWTFFQGREDLQASDLIPWMYPSDREIMDLNLRGIYLGNYIYWEANDHTELMIERYGFEISDEPFDRTYRRISNLDDMHENGVHDYLKFIKFGYGRGTDHVSKDVRYGVMDRNQGLELIRRYDHVKSSDLQRWLDYVGMTEDEFDRIADTFRDPRVWWREDGEWRRHELKDDNGPSSPERSEG